jgi:hypothetical protein
VQIVTENVLASFFLCLVKKKEEENCFLFFKVRRDWTVDIKDRNASLQTAFTIFLEQA